MNGPVKVVIDVLSVECFTEEQAGVMGDAVRAELARLIETEGMFHGLHAGQTTSATIDGVTVIPGRPAAAGADLARAIYEGLRP